MVRAGEVAFAVITSFARVPVPGEHILLCLTDAQRAQLGAEFGYGKSENYVPAIVRDSVLRQKDQWRKNIYLTAGRHPPSWRSTSQICSSRPSRLTAGMQRWLVGP
jgi:hypothetical protein